MKRLLITGTNSYIGKSFEQFIRRFPTDYSVSSISLRTPAWTQEDFSQYDVILHTAGIAHIKETPANAHLYYEVNRDLAVEVAKRAKAAHVKQFIFLSSMSVYGLDEGVITPETAPLPRTHYGKSKLQAEEQLIALQSDDFVISILRPPMVYGDGCKGNYQALVKLAGTVPIFPDYPNRRSMVSIDTLSVCFKEVIDHCTSGIFFPQESGYICTCKMVQRLAEEQGKHLKLVRWLNPLVSILKCLTRKGKKAFGSLIYQDLDRIELSGNRAE